MSRKLKQLALLRVSTVLFCDSLIDRDQKSRNHEVAEIKKIERNAGTRCSSGHEIGRFPL
jgi:hypothetical protein